MPIKIDRCGSKCLCVGLELVSVFIWTQLNIHIIAVYIKINLNFTIFYQVLFEFHNRTIVIAGNSEKYCFFKSPAHQYNRYTLAKTHTICCDHAMQPCDQLCSITAASVRARATAKLSAWEWAANKLHWHCLAGCPFSGAVKLDETTTKANENNSRNK